MDRRWCARKFLHMTIALEVPSYSKKVTAAILLDIGLGGAFIETDMLLPSDAVVIISLKLPVNLPQNSFRLNSRVVRRTPRGTGVAFVSMPAGLIKSLGEALAVYEQQLDPMEVDILSGSMMGNKLPV